MTAHFSGKKGILWLTRIPNGWSSSTLLFKTINTYTWYVLFLVYLILCIMTQLHRYSKLSYYFDNPMKIRFSKKAAQKIDGISELLWNFISRRLINWEILSNFSSLLIKFDLYLVTTYLRGIPIRECHSNDWRLNNHLIIFQQLPQQMVA